MNDESDRITQCARREAASMRIAVEGADRTSFVRIRVQQFDTLSRMIDQLCDIIAHKDEMNSWHPRYWVPLPEFNKVKSSQDALLNKCAALEARQSWQNALPVDDWQ